MTRTQKQWLPSLVLGASTSLGCTASSRPDNDTWVSPTSVGSVGDGDDGSAEVSDDGGVQEDDGGVEGDSGDGGVDDGGVDDAGEDATGGVPGGDPFPMWAVGGTVVPGTSLVGGGELFVVDDNDVISCVAGWDFTAVTPVTDCASCEFAFDLTIGEVEIEEEPEAGGCTPWLALAVEGTTERIGYAAGEVFRHDGRAWASVGEAEFDVATGEFFAEYEVDQ